ncbi:MAG: hypothetical protein AAF799_20280 [Myxococcota bacterium]
MFVLRSAQLDTLIDPPLVMFAERLIAFFSREHGWLLSQVPEDERVERIARAVRVALDGGIETEWDLCRFVILELQLGTTLGRPEGPAWALKILGDEENTGAGKADALEYHYQHVLDHGPQRQAV